MRPQRGSYGYAQMREVYACSKWDCVESGAAAQIEGVLDLLRLHHQYKNDISNMHGNEVVPTVLGQRWSYSNHPAFGTPCDWSIKNISPPTFVAYVDGVPIL